MIRELSDGAKCEYRHAPARALPLECRELRRDGYPHDDRWWPVNGEHWSILQRHSPEILRTLIPGLSDSATLTPRG